MDIHIIYASTSGNVEIVVESVAEVLSQKSSNVQLHRAEQTFIDVIKANSTFILATSTWEHGVLNPFFKKLHESLQKETLAGKKAAFIGLGDRRYEPVLFAQGMEILRQTWLDQGGIELGTRLRIQGEPYPQLEAVVKPWANTLIELLSLENTANA